MSEQLVPESVGNPARLIKLNPERARQRYVRDEEMPALLAAIDARHDPVARIYFRLILETGARKSELIAARWNDYDADNKTLTLRNTKAGHDITLAMSESACALVAELPRVDGSPWIFPSDSPDEPRFNFAREWKEIRDASGLQDLRLHDLRRTHGAILVRAGVSLPLVAARLGHKDITTTQQHYAPLETEAQRALAERVSAALSRGLPPVAK
ncbi:MAG: site-specific integrase [Proteobacteria bacterium]|nr:site-specific integrase [Pseudomonadota bacterium]